jgi:signal transduction histidine kinase
LGDLAELQTVIGNLLDNAIKYSPENPKISVRLRNRGDGNAEFYIHDNGIGVPRGDLKRIFKRFYRVPNSSAAAKGTGLGLAIVHSLVEKHGGTVRARSRGEGKGTTFFVRLPRV